jgi:ribosomal protein S6
MENKKKDVGNIILDINVSKRAVYMDMNLSSDNTDVKLFKKHTNMVENISRNFFLI